MSHFRLTDNGAAHRDGIESALAEYGGVRVEELPDWLRNPRTSQEFDLAMAVAWSEKIADGTVKLSYDDNGLLTCWHGIGIKGAK
jgi:hypothetical protein